MPLGIDPKVDYAFKKLFGSESTKDLLTHVLNAVLQPPAGSEIVDPVVLNPFNEKESTADKLSVLDIKARDAAGRTFHVEMQMEAWHTFPPRVLYYWSKAHGAQLAEGATFADLRPTLSVCFIGNQLFRQATGYHHHFRLMDPASGLTLTDNLGIHVLELGKFAVAPTAIRTPLEMWCYFLRHGRDLERAALPAPLDVPVIHRAWEVLDVMTKSEIEREQYESRWRAQMDERSRLHDARAEGMEKGIEKGMEKGMEIGREQGNAIGRVHLAQRLLKLPVTATEELLLLPLEECVALADRLEKDVTARLG